MLRHTFYFLERYLLNTDVRLTFNTLHFILYIRNAVKKLFGGARKKMWPLSSRGVGKALVAGTLFFFAASLRYIEKHHVQVQ